MLLDNTFRVKGNGPIVINTPPAEKADVIAVGNTWTVKDALMVIGRVTDQDNKVVNAGAIKSVRVAPFPFAPHVERPIIDVRPAAARLRSRKPSIRRRR